MNKKSERKSYRKIFMLTQLCILVGSILYLYSIYITNIRPDMLAIENFKETKCFIMSKKLATKGHIIRRYRANFLINYHAEGVQYNRWVSGNGLDMSYHHNNVAEEQALTDFDDGKNYQCWYDPKNPQIAMLNQRKRWFEPVTVMLPGLLGLVSFLFFMKNVWVMWRKARLNKK